MKAAKNNGNKGSTAPVMQDAGLQELESAVVASVLLDPKRAKDCAALRGNHFRSERLGRSWDALTAALSAGGDPLEALYAAGWTASHLSGLIDSTPAPSLAGFYAKKVLQAAGTRELQSLLATTISNIAADPQGDIPTNRISMLQAHLGTIIPQDEPISSAPLRDVLANLFDELDSTDDVIETGYSSLDSRFRGWPLGTLSLVAGRPGTGKSAFCLNAALRLAKRGVPVLVVALEDRPEQHARRLMAIQSFVPLSLLSYTGIRKLRDEAMYSVTRAAADLQELPIYFLGGPLTSLQIAEAIKDHTERLGVKVTFVDHVQEILPDESERRDQRTYEIQSAAQRLRDAAVKTNTAVVAAAQINREAVKAGRPSVAHLRDSGALEMIARLILLLHREEEQEKKIEVEVGKANHGPTGKPFGMYWDPGRCAIDDLTEAYG